ncbi:MAG TPA: HPr family phosphocarrier protein [Xanthobacteraceae bacterium]|nr:HPr family phosphocarrier protein [Xanthobacteraceae bacterium]
MTLEREFRLTNKKGLHARASARFVQTVQQFDAEVKVKRGEETAGGDSIMSLLMLAAPVGSLITVSASGNDAEAALDAIEKLLSDRFGEEE